MLHKVFVYGTLKRCQPNHYLVLEPPGQCTYLGRAITVEQWPLVVAGPFRVPYMLDVKGIGKVEPVWKLNILTEIRTHTQIKTHTYLCKLKRTALCSLSDYV